MIRSVVTRERESGGERERERERERKGEKERKRKEGQKQDQIFVQLLIEQPNQAYSSKYLHIFYVFVLANIFFSVPF